VQKLILADQRLSLTRVKSALSSGFCCHFKSFSVAIVSYALQFVADSYQRQQISAQLFFY
jgi:hypothetical protein